MFCDYLGLWTLPTPRTPLPYPRERRVSTEKYNKTRNSVRLYNGKCVTIGSFLFLLLWGKSLKTDNLVTQTYTVQSLVW